jgi:serine phosphatase RsbU (regulator of sigma subunit)/ligand-binding sensor domain-containing protein
MKTEKGKTAFLLFVIILLGSVGILFSTTGDIKFDHITIREGLSQSSVRSILQDRRGFMWFATVDGLNRYDGYSFKVHKPDPNDANTLSSPFLRAMIEDDDGILWIGTNGGGLNKYNPLTERFTRYRHNPLDPDSISNNYVWMVYEDPSHNIWLGTDGGGLNKFNRETETFTHYRYDPENPNTLSHDRVLSICRDRFGMLWIGTRGGGLNRFDPVSEHFTRFKYDPHDPGSLSHNDVWAILEDRSGTLWICTDGGGLNKYDRKNNRFINYRHDPDNSDSLGDDKLLSIYQDRDGALWIGTNGSGLDKFDAGAGIFTHYRHEYDKPYSLSDNYIHSIYEDKSGVLWFGTSNGGVNKLDKTREQFLHYRKTRGTLTALKSNSVWSIYEDSSGVIWFGTQRRELVKMDMERREAIYMDMGSGNNVRCIYEAPTEPGILWIAVDGGGLFKFDSSTGRFYQYSHDPENPFSLSSDRVYVIYEDNSGVLWIGTRAGGLNKFDRDTESFTHYTSTDDEPNSLNDDFVYDLLEDRWGTLWVGTFAGGLNKFNREAEAFISFRSEIDNPNGLSSNCILCIHEDHSGTLWLGTGGGGLNKFNSQTQQFTRYNETHGLPSAVIYGILEDDAGNLWLSTNDGISRFHPGAGAFKNYKEVDGLQSNEFNGGAYFKSPGSGEMFFGGINGFNSFFPGKIKDNTNVPPIVITDFLKFNKKAKLPVPISETKKLTLSHRDYVFSFEFAALDFTVPGKNKYAYKMEGLNEDWIYTDAWKRFAVFTTLSPGRYVFKVKGSNNDGIWNEEGVSIKVVITPPFWQTWWFRILAIFLGLLIALGLYKKNMQNLSVRTRMETELMTAHQAQMAIMPQQDPGVKGFDISGLCIPAHEVGGDFFDYLWLDEEQTHLAVAVGDVSGKAMKAAMTAVMSNGIIVSKAYESRSIEDILTRINKPLYLKTEKQVFTALCIASIDIRSKTMTYSNAGLNAPLLKRSDSVNKLESSGPRFPLGIRKNTRYLEKKIQLQAGDVIVLYTDGISESWNVQEELYGDERLAHLLETPDISSLAAREIIAKIMTDIQEFSGEIPQQDDMTVVVIKVL